MTVHLGLDVGSTTVKLVALDEDFNVLYQTYRRHMSDVKKTVRDVVRDCYEQLGDCPITVSVTGSGGLYVNKHFHIPFIQEVISLSRGISTFIDQTDVAIELGGEDSKIIYFSGSVESRMNSICAGGTGAFIDQMASLLKTDAVGLNHYAKKSNKIYPIASRCGVFAKTDVQALINQGASKEDISLSVLQSVVNQTISNLACGRPIKGNVAFLGGPLHFLPELKNRFVETLGLTPSEIISPEDGEIFVAKGAAMASMDEQEMQFSELNKIVEKDFDEESVNNVLMPLFNSDEELEAFRNRHSQSTVEYEDIEKYSGPMYLGIDSGSTTSKLVLLSEDNKILYSYYTSNGGDPLSVIVDQIKHIYEIKSPDSYFAYAGVTGYGEDFIKAALNLDTGEVETVAHFEAAKFFDPDVDFVIDIGGQDMKSMKIQDGVINSILLNEACSSGCGSFLETFSKSIGLSAAQFAELALSANRPVDLGSRCTVFMNSNVKQAQKEGADPADIAAGLAYSVIKNAIQKVIKIRNTDDLGEHIVVQGGTFLSDAVLKAFENLTGREVTRPVISGLMGAFGIALIAKRRAQNQLKKIQTPENGMGIADSKEADGGIRTGFADHQITSPASGIENYQGANNGTELAGRNTNNNRTELAGRNANNNGTELANRNTNNNAGRKEIHNTNTLQTAEHHEASIGIRIADCQGTDTTSPNEAGTVKSSILSYEELESFTYKSIDANCGRCSNNCRLKINIFPNGKRYITGNRCERGSNISDGTAGSENSLPNMFAEKYELLFNREILTVGQAKRGIVGIPRVLNIYENYPFWHQFFTTLGFRVILSDETTRNTYEDGIETIPSETACYPAKLVHGHIENLIRKKRSKEENIDFIFYPSIFYEQKNFKKQTNNLNCPVVCGYPEVIKNNMEIDELQFLNPFLSLNDRRKLPRRLNEIFPRIQKIEIEKACKNGFFALDEFKAEMRNRGQKALSELKKNNQKAVILCGRPYHLDKEINHGIPELITSLGLGVLTLDAIPQKFDVENPLRVLDQWTYHARLYRAAEYVADKKDIGLVQLNSFGCGLDAITTDQVHDILQHYGKIHTLLKIDEVSNLGAVKIRMRSLIETVENRSRSKAKESEINGPVLFTEEDRKKHTILMPQMSPIHFALISGLLNDLGFNLQILDDISPDVIQLGLKYVNNDACYPSMFVVGQFIEAVKSGKYDTDNLSLLISQTGGACRASNYVGLIRKALKDAGYGHVPVIALSFQGIEKHPGFNIPKKKLMELAKRLIISLQYGDLIQRCLCATRPYEKVKGTCNTLKDKWIEILKNSTDFSRKTFTKNVKTIIEDFSSVDVTDEKKPKVGIVGEILVKYLPQANNFLIEKLEQEGAEAVISDLTDFLLYSFKNPEYKRQELSGSLLPELFCAALIKYFEYYRKIVRNELQTSKYTAPEHINKIADRAERFVSLSNQYGEGWLLTGEMIDLIEHGVKNIICVQPFGCLPNHITGKGVIKTIRERYDDINIVPIDFDASASEVNQFNRIKLMLSVASENMKKSNSNKDNSNKFK